jgi:hypothetical protein
VRRVGLATAAVVLLLGTSVSASAKPASFALWWSHFSARVQRDVVRINHVCQKRYGVNDAKVGRCFVKHERVSLRLERAAWEKQVDKISRAQRAPCKQAIQRFRVASRKSAIASLRYLDSHRHSRLTQVSRDLNAEPFASLKQLTFEAKARAVRICG